jgi:sulfoacetaldehyde dehydrogenase
VGWEMYKDDNIKKLAESAVEETKMGNVKDKITKHKVKVLGVLNDIKDVVSVGLIEEDTVKLIKKYAKPVGIVGALVPVTNPTATPASNALSILKGKNAVIFAPHPAAKKSSTLAINLMRDGLKKVGAPEDLIQVIEEPSLNLTSELMKQVDLVLATGGAPMVKAAYSSGTPAYGVGPGNSVQIIAEDADTSDAAEKVILSKAFDNATSCSSENSIIIHESIYDEMLEELKKRHSYLCTAEERAILKEWVWKVGKKGKLGLNPAIIARDVKVIASEAGLSVPAETRILLIEGSHPANEDRFSGEKISPILTIWKYSQFDEGLSLLKQITDYAGRGHSCGIHTWKEEYIERLALEMQTSRIMVRQAQAPANGGNFFNGMPSTVTLGCGTWGGNITSENINYKHFLNVTWVSEPFPPKKPTENEIWGTFWEQYGK